MRSLALLARLLDYPTAELKDARREMTSLLSQDKQLPPACRSELIAFVDQLCTTDLLDSQENYVATFDRGRATSLLLFEHVHGESRDRGQAMVDLMNEYEQAGLQLDARELPDYLPLFLEFLSTREAEEIKQWLASITHILALVAERLRHRDSDYAVIFDTLVTLAGEEVDQQTLAVTVAAEERDDTPEAMDKVWEEEMVRFVDDQGASCGQSLAVQQRRDELGKVQTLYVQEPSELRGTGTDGI